MTPTRIKHFIFFILVFFSWANLAQADLEITEINNPEIKANHCWVKVYNNSPTEVNLTEWFVMDDDEIISPKPWHYHAINAVDSSILSPNSYAIIADSTAKTIDIFKSKNPNISDTLFYGSLTFKDEGTMGLSKDKKNIISKKSYGLNGISSDNDTDDESDTSNDEDYSTSSSSSSSTTEKVLPPLKITTKIISPKITVAGVPFYLSSLTTTNWGETYAVGRWVWNFGNGGIKEIKDSVPFEYFYEYPGEYALTLSYFDNSFNKTPDAVDKIIIKVVPAEIYISSVGNTTDPYVEIENKSNYEIILSNWIVTAGTHYFIIPEGTILLSNKKIKLSPKVTGFVGSDISFVSIADPNKEITATYPSQTKKLTSRVSSVSKVTPYINQISTDNNLSQENQKSKDSQVIDLNNLEASASGSKINISKSIYPFIGLLIIIGIGLASFLLIKKREKVDDYYVEGKINPKDITIIE